MQPTTTETSAGLATVFAPRVLTDDDRGVIEKLSRQGYDSVAALFSYRA